MAAMAAALHPGLAMHHPGIEEHMHHSKLTDEVFPHEYRFEVEYMPPGDTPGLGVDIDEALAARHPYQRAYLPVARKLHGTLTDWRACPLRVGGYVENFVSLPHEGSVTTPQ